MQSNPRLSANLPVMLVRIPVDLPAQPTRLGIGGPWGSGLGEYTWERLVRSPNSEDMMRMSSDPRLMRLMMRLTRLTMRLLLGIARNITRNITRIVLGSTWNITRTVLMGVLLVTIVDRSLPIFRTFLGDVFLQDYYFTSPLFFFQMMSSGGIR